MRKQLTLSGAAYCKLKANRKKRLPKYTSSIDACVKKKEKMGRANDERGSEQEEKQDPYTRMKIIIFFHLNSCKQIW